MSNPSERTASLLRTLVLGIFDERDAARRTKAIEDAFAADCDFVDPNQRHRGRAAVEEAVVRLQAARPGFRFQLTSEPQVIDGAGRVTWAFGPPENPKAVTGMDVVTVSGGRIAVLLTFLDPPAGAN